MIAKVEAGAVGSTSRHGHVSRYSFVWSSSNLQELLRVWPTRFAWQYGPLRPVVERVLRAFMRCGLVEHGFARLWCPTCWTSVTMPLRLPVAPAWPAGGMQMRGSLHLHPIVQPQPS